MALQMLFQENAVIILQRLSPTPIKLHTVHLAQALFSSLDTETKLQAVVSVIVDGGCDSQDEWITHDKTCTNRLVCSGQTEKKRARDEKTPAERTG